MRQSVYPSLVKADASADANGIAIQARNLLYISAQAVVTGTSTGTLKFQFSNDIVDPTLVTTPPTNWSDVPSATVAIAGAGVYVIPKTDLCYEYIRVVFVHTNAAAGTISCNTKVIGA